MKTASVLTAAAGLALAAAANAQFSGPYAPGNWTFTNNGGDGSVNTAGAPASVQIIGDNGGAPGGQDTDFTIAAAASGTLSFNWLYNTVDTGTWDSAYYLVNGVETFLANNTTPGASGAVSVPVLAGQIIGFRVRSGDGGIGAADMTITNFSAPIPGPGSLALLGLGGLVMARRRRR